eukprot:4134010-Amphidinium_carterae.1
MSRLGLDGYSIVAYWTKTCKTDNQCHCHSAFKSIADRRALANNFGCSTPLIANDRTRIWTDCHSRVRLSAHRAMVHLVNVCIWGSIEIVFGCSGRGVSGVSQGFTIGTQNEQINSEFDKENCKTIAENGNPQALTK